MGCINFRYFRLFQGACGGLLYRLPVCLLPALRSRLMQSRPARSVCHRFPDRVPGWRRQGSDRSELFGWSAFAFVLGRQWEPLSNLKGKRHLKSEHDMGTLASKLSVEIDPNNRSNIGAAPDAISAFKGCKQNDVRDTLVAKRKHVVVPT